MDGVNDTSEWEVVYNLRIADYHTYFVGDDAWGWCAWAHNEYLGLSNPTVRKQGADFADLAIGWRDTLPDEPEPNRHPKHGSTVAVTEVAGKKYVALYGNLGSTGACLSQTEIDNFLKDAKNSGWIAIHTSGDVHAERALYERVPDCKVIGISNSKGPCEEKCKGFFERVKFYNIVWPGPKKSTWGNS